MGPESRRPIHILGEFGGVRQGGNGLARPLGQLCDASGGEARVELGMVQFDGDFVLYDVRQDHWSTHPQGVGTVRIMDDVSFGGIIGCGTFNGD